MESSSLSAVARRSSDGVERRPCTWALHVDRARFPASSAKHLPFGKFSVFIVWTCPRPLRLPFLPPPSSSPPSNPPWPNHRRKRPIKRPIRRPQRPQQQRRLRRRRPSPSRPRRFWRRRTYVAYNDLKFPLTSKFSPSQNTQRRRR